MIAIARSESDNKIEQPWQTEFANMLPQIECRLRFEFRYLKPEARQESHQEAIVSCLTAFRRLVQQGRGNVASANSLAMYSARHVKAGRTATTRLNRRDPLSRYAQLLRGSKLERLDRRVHGENEWVENIIEDPRARVIDQVALRIDIAQWLREFPRRIQWIARDPALGWSTADVARKYRVTAARISQIRRELNDSWNVFQGNAG